MRERQLGLTPDGDFNQIVRRTWQDPDFTYPEGESNRAAQVRGRAVLDRIRTTNPGENIVLCTHGNLLALMLQSFDPAIGFDFWQSLSMPDVYRLDFFEAEKFQITHYWWID